MEIIETEIMETVVIPKTIKQYKAFDGKMFSDEKSCLHHEAVEKFNTLIVKSMHCPDALGVYDTDVFLMKIRNEEELNILIEGSKARVSIYGDSYVEGSADKVVKSFPCNIIYFENEAYNDIYSADVFVSQCLNMITDVVK